MLLIKDILISDDLFETYFHCDLSKCKGACCWEGDYGAPLTADEVEIIKSVLPVVKKVLPDENIKILEQKGPSEYYVEPEVTGTSLLKDASCVYLLRDENGIGRCAFEMLHSRGEITFKKPISCELYPIRLIENHEVGFTAMNYDKWDICSPGCSLGEQKKLPLFRFLKNAIIRKFGEEFFDELEAYYAYHQKK